VPLAETLRSHLLAHRLHQGRGGQGYAFAAATGRPFDPPTTIARARRAWQRAGLAQIGLKHERTKELRPRRAGELDAVAGLAGEAIEMRHREHPIDVSSASVLTQSKSPTRVHSLKLESSEAALLDLGQSVPVDRFEARG
jgi:hypothetical protein